MPNDTFQLTRPAHQYRLDLTEPRPVPESLTERHRPREIAEVVGQPAICRRIEAFLLAPYSAAFLFVGPTGVGKTTLARIVAASLGAVEFGGLDEIRSGMQDRDGVEAALGRLRFTPMLGSGWKVVIVDEADYMSVAAAQLWLSALENLPGRSVIVFTTNNVSRLQDRFVDRCERFDFAADGGEAQQLVERIWRREAGSAAVPRLADLPGVVADDGTTSYRRVVRALEPLLVEARSAATARRPSKSRHAIHADLADWRAIADRFTRGETLVALGRELGVEWRTVDYWVSRLGVTRARG